MFRRSRALFCSILLLVSCRQCCWEYCSGFWNTWTKGNTWLAWKWCAGCVGPLHSLQGALPKQQMYNEQRPVLFGFWTQPCLSSSDPILESFEVQVWRNRRIRKFTASTEKWYSTQNIDLPWFAFPTWVLPAVARCMDSGNWPDRVIVSPML